MCPKDKSARQRLETCKIARRRSAFEEAIASDSTPFYLSLQPDSMGPSSSSPFLFPSLSSFLDL